MPAGGMGGRGGRWFEERLATTGGTDVGSSLVRPDVTRLLLRVRPFVPLEAAADAVAVCDLWVLAVPVDDATV